MGLSQALPMVSSEGGSTREQMAVILWRYAKYKGQDVSVDPQSVYEVSVMHKVSGYAQDALCMMRSRNTETSATIACLRRRTKTPACDNSKIY